MRASDTEQQYDAGDRESVAEKTKRTKAREVRRLNGLRQIMQSSDGRLWMWDFLSRCGLFSVEFTANASKEAFALGMRNAAMPVFADIQRECMPEYLTMTKESN